jgi:hypothetical protein
MKPSKKNYLRIIEETGKLVILVFYRKSNKQWKSLETIYNKLSYKYSQHKFLKADVDNLQCIHNQRINFNYFFNYLKCFSYKIDPKI